MQKSCDILFYNLTDAPGNMSIENDTGKIIWTPDEGGEFKISLSVSDGNSTDSQNYSISVASKSKQSMGNRDVSAGGKFEYYFNRSGLKGEDLSYELISGAEGMSINNTTGKLDWTPNVNQSGVFKVRIRITDSLGNELDQDLDITVWKESVLSVLTSIDNETVKGKIIVSGTINKDWRNILRIEYRLDDGDWTKATGILDWNFTIDTKGLNNGRHRLEIRAVGENGTITDYQGEFTVENPTGVKGQTNWVLIIGITTTICAICGIAFLIRKKRIHK